MARATRECRVAVRPRTGGPRRPRRPTPQRRLRSLGYVAGSADFRGQRRGGRTRLRPRRRSEAPRRAQRALQLRARRPSTTGRPSDALDGFRAVLAERPDFLTARTSAATVLIADGRAKRGRVAPSRGAGTPGWSLPTLQAKLGIALREAGDLGGRGRSPRTSPSRRRRRIPNSPTISASSMRGWDGRTTRGRCFRSCSHRDPDDASDVEQSGRAGICRRGAGRGRPSVSARGGRRPGAWRRLAGPRRRPRRTRSAGARSRRGAGPNACCRTTTTCCSTWVWCWPRAPIPRESLPYLERFVREAPRDRYARPTSRRSRP